MNIKISILILFLILLINNVYGETGSYELEYDIINIAKLSGYTNAGDFSITPSAWIVNDVVAMKTISFLECDIKDNYWTGSNEISSWDWVSLYSDASYTNKIGTGVFGYIKSPSTDSVRVQLHIGTNLDWGVLTGLQKIYIPDSGNLESMRMNRWKIVNPGSKQVYLSESDYGKVPHSQGSGIYSNHTVEYSYSFTNPYEYSYNNEMGCFNYTLYRNSTFPSKLYINNSNTLIINETSIKTDNFPTYSFELDYPIWDTIVTTENDDIIQIEINFSSLYIEPDLTQPTLTTDKTTYNTNEKITISFTNLNNIINDGNSPIDLRSIIIMYPDIDKYTGYGKKYIYNLLYHEYEGNFTINTSFLSPQTDYILFACDGMDKILFEGDSFNVYSDNEYLSISCDANSNCITGNNAKNTFYYKINNNSDIIIKDNDNNIINIYHNIIGTGSIIYTIPEDIKHLNTYPNWKVYLNNTDYSTSYNKNMIVYWSLFVSPTSTPTPYPTNTPDIIISDIIDEFKTETQPIKDLIFGLSEIVIDNPDYNKDNIVDENEINHWFNSLISICIIFLLVVLYIGLKKKRE